MGMDEDNDDGLGGRTRARREAGAAHRYGRRLLQLDDLALDALGLTEQIRAEVDIGRKIEDRGALKRQTGYLDKLLRRLDEPERERIGAWLDAYDDGVYDDLVDPVVERWLARLMSEGDAAVTELVAERPGIEVQRLRQLVRNARKEREKGRGIKARAALRALLTE